MAKRSITVRAREVLAFARQLKDEDKDWVEAHNALFGPRGKCEALFPTDAERKTFITTPEYKQIRELLRSLPERSRQGVPGTETASGDLLVRLPRSLLAALRDEAEEENIPLNQLIVAKLAAQLRSVTGADNLPREKKATA
jgi:hypothetical protein